MKEQKDDELPPVLVPFESVNPETLDAILESFVLREGTDYGVHEISLDQKILTLKKQLIKNEILLVFDPNTESLTLLSKREWAQSNLKNSTQTHEN